MSRYYYGRKVYTKAEKIAYWQEKHRENAELDRQFRADQRANDRHRAELDEIFAHDRAGEKGE